MNVAALLALIDDAFPLNPIPEFTLRQAVLADEGMSREISEDAWHAEWLKDGHLAWKEISDESLVQCNWGVAHLDEESFAYYLGALLSFAIRHPETMTTDQEWNLVSATVFSLAHKSNYNLSRLKTLNDKQIDCVIQFLQFVADHGKTHKLDAENALSEYWLTPEARTKGLIHLP